MIWRTTRASVAADIYTLAASVMLVAGSLFIVAGCSSRPGAISPPDIKPGKVAAAAFQQYDTSGDGVIDGSELQNASSIRSSLDRIDANNDRNVQLDELTAFMERYWVHDPAGIIRIRCVVNFEGSPLDGATVTLIPEAFMAGLVNPASGVTQGGTASLDVSDEHRPHPNAHGAQTGFYLVRVSKQVDGKEIIPKKYNEETILGCEVARHASYLPGPIVLDLK